MSSQRPRCAPWPASRSRRSLGAGAGRTQPLAQARARPASRVPRASRDQTHARAPQSRTEHEPDADVSEASVTARAKRVVVDPYLGTNQWPPPGTERLSLRTDLADVLLQPVPRLRLHVALPPLGLPFRLARRHARADLRWPTARPTRIPGPRILIGTEAARPCSGCRHRHGAPPQISAISSAVRRCCVGRPIACVYTSDVSTCHMAVDAPMEITTHSRRNG